MRIRPFAWMPRPLRWPARTLAVLVAVGLVGAGAGVWLVRQPFPQVEGRLRAEGLTGEVTVHRDRYGVPHVYADTAEDLFLAQGYVHAQDRFWEMDFRRHVTAGRLSELFGSATLTEDKVIRTMGWRRVAEQELPMLEERTRRYLDAYAMGVNAWLAAHEGAVARGLPYMVLKLTNSAYRPEPWTSVDSLAWLKAMAWDLRSNMDDEIARALAASALPRERVEQLWPEYPFDRHPPIVTRAPGAAGREGRLRGGPTAAQSAPGGGPTTGGATGGEHRIDGGAHGDGANGAGGNGRRGNGDGGHGGGGHGGGTAGRTAGGTAIARAAAALRAVPDLIAADGDGVGSNSWVVSGAHTASGKPLLANDPHLSPSLPSVWYQAGLHCRTKSPQCPFDVTGFTFSGMPGVIIGHNDRIAWGFTNLGPDVADLYVERLRDDTYLFMGEWKTLAVRHEQIEVAGGSPVRLTVRETLHGPIVSDVLESAAKAIPGAVAAADGTTDPQADAPDAATPDPTDAAADAPADDGRADTGTGTDPTSGIGGRTATDSGPATGAETEAVTLRWTALDPGGTADAVFAVNAATNWQEFRQAAARFEVPAQNMVYADVDGNIGYQAPGHIPIRAKGDGAWPVPGWTGEYAWQGKIPFNELPSVFNPPEGYIVTANNAVAAPARASRPLARDWAYGYRSRRITDLLTAALASGRVDTEQMARIQMDDGNGLAAVLVPRLLEVELAGPSVAARELLRDWDHGQGAGSAPAAYFNAVWRRLLAVTFDDELPEGARPTGGDRWFEVMRTLLDRADDPFWDDRETPGVETRDDMLRRALSTAYDELADRLGDEPRQWRWGDLHSLTLTERSFGGSGIAPIEWLFNRGPLALGGSKDAVNATGWHAQRGYEVNWLPSMRMVVDLADLDKSRWINLTGASGHPFHDNYWDQTRLWADGRTIPMLAREESIKAAATATLTLTP